MTDDSTGSDAQPSGKLAALRYRDFRLFWTGHLISNIGTWMQMTATNWLLYQLTGSPVLLGLNGIFRAVPAIGLGVISGTFADRYDRRKLLLWTEVVSGLLALGLAVLDHSGRIEPWHIYALHVPQCLGRILRWAGAPSAVSKSSPSLRLAQRRSAQFFVVEGFGAPGSRFLPAWQSVGWEPRAPFTPMPQATSPSWSPSG